MVKFHRLLLLIAGLFLYSAAHAQCPWPSDVTAYGTGTAGTTCDPVTTGSIPCHYFSEYATFNGLTIGYSYTMEVTNPTSTSGGPYEIGVFTSTSTGTSPIAYASSATFPVSVTFTATTSTVYTKVFKSGCISTGTECNYYTLQCNSCPPPVPVTVQPVTSPVNAGTADNQVLRIDVGTCTASNVTSIICATSGTSNTADLVAARIYFTTSATFSTAVQFGNTITNPNGTMTFTGNQSIAGGTGYFWLAYDVACNATINNEIDGACTSVVINSATLAPAVANPAGKRSITPGTTSSLSQPTTSPVSGGSINAQVLRIDIPGTVCLGNLTALNIINASTNISDISAARAYITNSPVFSATTQFGSDIINPGSNFAITGSTPLVPSGINYVWVVYDLNCSAPATTGNVADAGIASYTTSIGGSNIFITQNPAGQRTITPFSAEDNIQTAPIYNWSGTNAFSIAGRSVQHNEPSPILSTQPTSSNGSNTSNYSWGSAADQTQWYRLVVPTSGLGSSGNLLIRAITSGSGDTHLALWKFPNMIAGTCSTIPDFSGGVLLAANDDALVIGAGYTGGSSLNSVVRVRLTPGQTYYIQIDGYDTSTPSGTLIVEDLADPAGKQVPNNGLGTIHNPVGADMRFASYEVIGDDGWTYYYANNGTVNTIVDDVLLMSINWTNSSTYLWKGSNSTGTDLMSHVRRDATSTFSPSSNGPGSSTSTDAFIVWSGRNNASAATGDLKVTAPYVQAPHWLMMNKYWNVFPTIQPSVPLGVKMFYHDNDFNALQAAVAGVPGATPLNTHSDMKFIKATKGPSAHYTNAELNPASGHNAISLASVSYLPWTNTDNVFPGQPGINMAQFNISSFSGGGGGGGGTTTGPLPVTLLAFNVTSANQRSVLLWNVANELNVKEYVIERSTDSRTWLAIGTVRAIGASVYDYTDNLPAKGLNYYRLAIRDLNGSIDYSMVRAVSFTSDGLMVVYPNPANDKVYISGCAEAVDVHLFNEIGQLMLSFKTNGRDLGTNGLDISRLKQGAYTVRIQGASTQSSLRFVKQ